MGKLSALQANLNGTPDMNWSLRAMGTVAAMVAVACIGSLKVLMPLCGDTAMFLTAAKILHSGGTLYVDFWDFKQPGVYWFFLAGGSAFGFTQLGIRCFELIYMTAFAGVMTASLWRAYERPWLAVAAPVLALGSYYAAASSWFLTQVEILVAFPIFVAARLLIAAVEPVGGAGCATGDRQPTTSSRTWLILVAAGLAAGVALVFKLVLGLLFVGLVLIAARHRAGSLRIRPYLTSVLALGVPMAAGAVAVFVAAASVYAVKGVLGEFAWSTFVFPGLAFGGSGDAPIMRLIQGILWFSVKTVFPLLLLAAITLPRLWNGREPLLTKLMVTWVVAGFAVILIQRFSWWGYHFLLLIVPTALLATRGIDLILDWWQSRQGSSARPSRRPAMLVAGVAFAAIVVNSAVAVNKLKYAVNEGQIDIERYRTFVSEEYRKVFDLVAALEASAKADSPSQPLPTPQSTAGAIYIMGNPLFYVLTGRPQAIPINGWGWGYNPQSFWDQLPKDLAQAKPEFLYVVDYYDVLLKKKSPQTQELIDRDFAVVLKGDRGVLYRREADGGHSHARRSN